MLTIIRRIRFVDVRSPIKSELGPRDIDPILERGAFAARISKAPGANVRIIVNRHELFVGDWQP